MPSRLRTQIPYFAHAPHKRLQQLALFLEPHTVAPNSALHPDTVESSDGLVYVLLDGSLKVHGTEVERTLNRTT